MVALVSWVGVSPAYAGAGLENPCGVLGENGTAAVGDLHVIVADLMTRAYGLTLLSQEIIVYILDAFATFFTNDKLSSLEHVDFIKPINQNTTIEEAKNAAIDPAAAFLSHWTLVYKLLVHLDHLCHHGEIGASQGDGSNTAILHHLLSDLRQRAYSLVCDLKIGMNTLGTATTVPTYEPPDLFFIYGQTLMTELHRAYIVTRESEMVNAHLKIIYTEMENKLE